MSNSTVTTRPEDFTYPTLRLGQEIDGDAGGRVTRTEYTPGGSQTVWLLRCPAWCHGHNPDESGVSRVEDYDWSTHYGPEGNIWLPGLSDYKGAAYREFSSVHMDSCQVERQEPMISLRAEGDITPSEARSVARMLERLADTLERAPV